jgi:hypothetical protein
MKRVNKSLQSTRGEGKNLKIRSFIINHLNVCYSEQDGNCCRMFCWWGGCDVTSLLPFYTFALSPGLRPAAKTRPPLNIANRNAL